jgi:AcrR family transcriptional regulator
MLLVSTCEENFMGRSPSSEKPKRENVPQERQRESYHHGDLRQSLIDAAIALIQEGQMAQVSLREVSRRVGVSHNAPYRHFSDRDALLSAVSEQGFQRLQAATAQALVGMSVDGVARLNAIGYAYIQFALTNPAYYRVMFSLRDCQGAGLQQAMQGAFGVLLDVIQSGQERGVFRGEETLLMAEAAWAYVHGISMLVIDGQFRPMGEQEFEQFLGRSLQLFIEGVAQ